MTRRCTCGFAEPDAGDAIHGPGCPYSKRKPAGRPMVAPGSINYARGVKRKPRTRIDRLVALLTDEANTPRACGHNTTAPSYAIVTIRPVLSAGKRPTGAADHASLVCLHCAAEVLGLLRELGKPT